jgi:uncharacterized protein YwgA/O-acetyl-ADP-ribose deacetylase (regulator of RNase III)
VTVNCVGVMGKGIALEAKERYPELFKEYEELCDAKKMKLGRPVYVSRLLPPSFLLFPTKDHWRSVSKLSDIEEGLKYLAANYREWKIASLAVPPLGCGHGGLEWAVVGPALYRGLAELDVPVYLFVPTGVPANAEELGHLQAALATPDDVDKARRTSPPEVVAIVLALQRVLQERPSKEIGRILMQKLGYFALAAGINASIRFARRSFGPYSADWMAQIRHLVNNGLLVERRAGPHDAFAYEPGPSLREYANRIAPEVERYTPAIERLARLIARFTPDQAEFAATAHMVATELGKKHGGQVKDDDIVAGVQAWKVRRGKPFPEERIRSCLTWLRAEGWLPLGTPGGPDSR